MTKLTLSQLSSLLFRARDDLVSKGVLARKGSGRGTHYVLVWNRDKNGTNGTDASSKKMGH
jgi:hypothetical protein